MQKFLRILTVLYIYYIFLLKFLRFSLYYTKVLNKKDYKSFNQQNMAGFICILQKV